MRHIPRTQVVVVGGGPVGMLLAAELGAHGVGTVVFETGAATVELPKAGTLHARSVQQLARRGYPMPGPVGSGPVSVPFHFAGMPGLTITGPADEPEPLLKRTQAALEADFETRARERGVTVLRGHQVRGVRQTADSVEVTAEGPDGPVTCTADYAVGADGARSTVRESAGFDADTHPATVSALMGLVRFDAPGDVPVGWQRTERGWTVCKVSPGGYGRCLTLDCSGPRADRNTPLTLDELRAEASRIAGYDIPMSEARFMSRFSDFSRLVRHYRKGRVFLAGDSAHVHFPVGGQGLSVGIQDAFNLSWKLAHTLHGTAGPGLLDTYDAERRPAAQRVIDNTRAQLVLMRPDPALDPLRELFTELMTLDQVSTLIGDMVSDQETVYPRRTGAESVWEGTFLPNLRLTTPEGARDVIGLLGADRPLLLVFDGDGATHRKAAAPWAGVVRTVTAAPEPVLAGTSVLVRPDGYVGWASDGGDLADALRLWFGQPAPE
ncbi:FAD-dependent monooxygenase [Streptomyces sp. DT24]|uniref:FAD-dependent monooxygenase n=1 Tax=Streptomyces sp. DT24 TaxID=3416520 RepID=UPI003CEA9E66